MSEAKSQSLKSHVRFDPPYHFVLSFVFIANLVFAVFHLVRHWSDARISAAWFLVLSLFAFIPFLKLRSYPLKVQDRVIRLEERIRLQTLAPTEWHTQFARLSEDQ